MGPQTVPNGEHFSFLRDVPSLEGLPITGQLKAAFGFVPNFFLAQAARPDLIDSEVHLIGSILMKEGALTRQQKEYIFIVCSAANLSTYCLTAHCEIVRMLGIDGPEPEQIAVDHSATNLPIPTKALLNFALKLNNHAKQVTGDDIDALRTYGFGDRQILEAVLMVALTNFATFISFGLGTVTEFDTDKIAFPPPALARP